MRRNRTKYKQDQGRVEDWSDEMHPHHDNFNSHCDIYGKNLANNLNWGRMLMPSVMGRLSESEGIDPQTSGSMVRHPFDGQGIRAYHDDVAGGSGDQCVHE